VRMLNLYEIELVAGGWGTTGETLDGMPIDDDNHITVTGRLPGIPALGFSYGYGGPETGNSYPGDPADLGAGNAIADQRDPNWFQSLIDNVLKPIVEGIVGRETKTQEQREQNENTITQQFIKQDYAASGSALTNGRQVSTWYMKDGSTYWDINGNGKPDYRTWFNSDGSLWGDDGSGATLLNKPR
jgi:hypothetical protein